MYNDEYEDGVKSGYEDGYRIGHDEGFDAGYTEARNVTTKEFEEDIERMQRHYSARIRDMNDRIGLLLQEIYDLRKEHATTTRSLPKSTE